MNRWARGPAQLALLMGWTRAGPGEALVLHPPRDAWCQGFQEAAALLLGFRFGFGFGCAEHT